MNKQFLNKVKNIKKEQKQSAEILANKNLLLALENEQFALLYKQEKDLTITLAKKNNQTSTDLKKLETLKQQQNDELKKINLLLEDLLPKYTCPVCEDTGIINDCYCKCIYTELSKILCSNSGLTNFHKFDDAKFDIYDEENQTKIKNLFKNLKNWCENPKNINTILLSGKTGVGKSFAMECMASDLIAHGNYVCFSTAFNLNQDFFKYISTYDNSKHAILQPYLESDFLFIDDLGTEPIYNHTTLDYLYLIINERIVANKHTVISTNLDISELMQRYEERIVSRLIHKTKSKAFRIDGPDLRFKK